MIGEKRISNEEIETLKQELQQQRGMLWLLGEMMKSAINITSFKHLMSILTDMLMGVMGVTTCCLWYKTRYGGLRNYTLFVRSTEQADEFKEVKEVMLPSVLKNIDQTYLFRENEIEGSLVENIEAPKSRLAIPLMEFEKNRISGILVLEHKDKDFFTPNIITFFETLTIFIASKTENSILLQNVAEKSIKDPLTQIYNRGYLKNMLEHLYTKYEYVTAAIIDTDNFKKINDELGHAEGDTALKAIAQLAKGIVKEHQGEVIRYGGDEFVILLPKPMVEAMHILEEFRKTVPYLGVAYDIPVNISVTLGVCSYPEMIQDYSQIIQVADSALLKGKLKGKNCIILASDEAI